MDSNEINEWMFTVDLLPVVAANLLNDVVPRLNSRTVGRPFPEGIEPKQGQAPPGLKKAEEQQLKKKQGSQRRRDRGKRRRDQ
jgi:hypothetical protein